MVLRLMLMRFVPSCWSAPKSEKNDLQTGPKESSRWSQNTSRMSPKWLSNCFKMSPKWLPKKCWSALGNLLAIIAFIFLPFILASREPYGTLLEISRADKMLLNGSWPKQNYFQDRSQPFGVPKNSQNGHQEDSKSNPIGDSS